MGTVLVPAYAPFARGEPIPFGVLWTVDFRVPGGRPAEQLSPLDYYLAGAAGVPIA